MGDNTEQFVKTKDIFNFIIKYIYSDEAERIFKSTNFYSKENCTSQDLFDAMQYGINWAAILIGSSEIPKYYGETAE